MAVHRKKRRLDARGPVLRRARIFARLREGWAYDEVAREEELTPERVRRIVQEALARRPVDDETDHAKLQLARLAPAMQIVGQAVADGDVKAMPFLNALDRLDRCKRVAKVNQVYDDEALKEALRQDQPRRRQSRLRPREVGRRGEDSDAAAGKEDENGKMPWGVGASA